ncbi:hypothetical protein V6M85_02265 [Sulfolobus tengchongensis]|uniref:Thermopsin n=1 Tax=Sulfolobus tengchongensis TaxID=207809 RepID=A0AAX4L2N7_9CREN
MRLILIILLLVLVSIIFIPTSHSRVSYVIEIASILPFKVNDTIYSPGTYYFNYRGLINVTFINFYYQSNTSRMHLIGININGTLFNFSSSQLVRIAKIYVTNNFTSVIFNATQLYSTYVSPEYVREFYVIVHDMYGSPVTTGWYLSGELLRIPQGTMYQNGSVRYIITHVYVNGSEKFAFSVNSPLVVNITYLIQYLVNFSRPTTLYVNNSLETLNTEWLSNGTQLVIPQFIYLNKVSRIYTIGNVIGLIYVTKPLFINDTQIMQYYLEVKYPIIAQINNSNYTNLTSNWYNYGTKIFIPQYLPLINGYRLVVYGNVTGIFTIVSPMIINDHEFIQYNLQFPFPLQISVSNGSVYYISNIWVDNGTFVTVNPQIHYINNGTRAIIPRQSFSSPNYGKLNYTIQYLVVANLPVPLSVNGTNVTITTAWFNQGTKIYIYPVYYFNSTVRLVFLNANYRNVTLSFPLNLNVYYIKEYLVNLKGYYSNSTIFNENLWEPYGSIVQIPLQYEYDGVYFQSNSSISQYYVTAPASINIYYYPISTSSGLATSHLSNGIPLIAFITIIIIIITSAFITIAIRRR